MIELAIGLGFFAVIATVIIATTNIEDRIWAWAKKQGAKTYDVLVYIKTDLARAYREGREQIKADRAVAKEKRRIANSPSERIRQQLKYVKDAKDGKRMTNRRGREYEMVNGSLRPVKPPPPPNPSYPPKTIPNYFDDNELVYNAVTDSYLCTNPRWTEEEFNRQVAKQVKDYQRQLDREYGMSPQEIEKREVVRQQQEATMDYQRFVDSMKQARTGSTGPK